MLGVMVFCLVCLSLGDSPMNIFVNLEELIVKRIVWSLICFTYQIQGDDWVSESVDEERAVSRGRVYCIVKCKLDEVKVFVPIVLIVVDEMSERFFKSPMDIFRLSIRLWVECCGHFEYRSQFCH